MICPVTYPNYGTPRFTESAITGIPFSTLAIPPDAIAQDDVNCLSLWYRPRDPAYPTYTLPPEFGGVVSDDYPNIYHFWTNVDDPTDADRFVPITFDFPTGHRYNVTVSVAATDDPCHWDVIASIQTQAFAVPAGKTFPFPNENLYPGSPPAYDWNNQGMILDLVPSVIFSKRVHRWDGPPPTIAYSTEDCVNPTDYQLGDVVQHLLDRD